MQVIDFECSRCGAKKGELCKTPRGRYADIHGERTQAWWKAGGGKIKALRSDDVITQFSSRGFTLVELLVVISIVCILAALVWGNWKNRGVFEEQWSNGHRYLREKSLTRVIPLVHDPDCPKCKPQPVESNARSN